MTATNGYGQGVQTGQHLPSSAITLAELKTSARGNKQLDLGRLLSLGVTPSVTQDIDPGQHYREVYLIRLRPRQAAQIDLTSRKFDALLRLYDEAGTLLAEDDDSGGDRNARLYVAQEGKGSGRFYLVATAVEGRRGEFKLEFRERETAASASRRPISGGESISGILQEGSPLHLKRQLVYQTYSFEGSPGDRIRVQATAQEPIGLVLSKNGQSLSIVMPSENETAQSVFETLSEAGKYEIAVLGKPDKATNYTLKLTALPPPEDNAAPTLIGVGQELNSAFAPNSPVVEGTNVPYVLYRVDGRAGQAISFFARTLQSSEPANTALRVEVGVDTPVGFAAARHSSAMTAPGRTEAGVVKFDRDGPVLLRVTAPTGWVGPFKIGVTSVDPERASAPASQE
jgi:hypothetical protein